MQAWVSALRGREADMRAAVARARELGGLDAGPLPDGFASLESSLAVLGATFGWGDVSAMPRARHALGRSSRDRTRRGGP